MAYNKPRWRRVVETATLVLLLAIGSRAQKSSRDDANEERQDHSCTVGAAGIFGIPEGEDRNNFDKAGWGFQGGGGVILTKNKQPDRGSSWGVTANYMYEKFKANAKSLGEATISDPTLDKATSAHGGFSAITLDLVFRHGIRPGIGFYASGGFGWLRRGIGFDGANSGTLLQSGGSSLDRLASNSGVFDAGVGLNFKPRKFGGVMPFVEIRVYRGTAINSGSTLVPLSLGVRW